MSTCVVAHRRALHAIPEVGMSLPKTCAYVETALSSLACSVFRPIPMAVCGYFDAGKAETIAFRADMDALPLTEVSDLPYASTHPGTMHACGHDGHSAMALALGQYVSDHLADLPYNVLLIFQPDEEGDGGAQPICDTGIFETYHVKRVFGLHVWPNVEAGKVFTRPGPMMARTNEIDITVKGKSVHMSRWEEGRDAMTAGMAVLNRCYDLVATLPATSPCKFRCGKMTSGTVRNAVSEGTMMETSLRTFDEETYQFCTQGFEKIRQEVMAETGCEIEISINNGYPAVWNNEDLLATVNAQLGDDAPLYLEKLAMAAEDFSCYQHCVPGVYFFLGLGNAPELHTTNFNFDDEAILPKGVAFLQKLLYLA